MSTIGKGVHSIEALRERCHVDEDTGCWHWRGGTNGRGSPSVWCAMLERRTSLGRIIGALLTGEDPPRDAVWFVTCSTPNCANPEHRKRGKRLEQMRKLKDKPIPKVQVLRIAASRRRASSWSDDVIEQVRHAEGTLAEVGEKFGMSMSHVWRIRQGKARRPLNASIFGAAGVRT